MGLKEKLEANKKLQNVIDSIISIDEKLLDASKELEKDITNTEVLERMKSLKEEKESLNQESKKLEAKLFS
ncbi:hypothetical protein GCM10011409_19210 [Lentibacillus populi]|uniref:Uncharacterized protein n=1 Tax=Lentibacillus populi TaxID=1827502 RepID=A0A9W5TX34_9BACI|nr:hypothetical protein [Lentibacillus populi]GGB41825.1 hypothetical protein GCM10011409_19210 [Lentibacillus populi]